MDAESPFSERRIPSRSVRFIHLILKDLCFPLSYPVVVPSKGSTSSYITISGNRIYAMGGPSGQVYSHSFDGGIGERIQEVLFEAEDVVDGADVSAKALVSLSCTLFLARLVLMIGGRGEDSGTEATQ